MLGCKDPLGATAKIAREETPALNRAADPQPGGNVDGPAEAVARALAKRGDASSVSTASGADRSAIDEDGGKVSPAARAVSSRGRRRRARSGAVPGGPRRAGGTAQDGVVGENIRDASALSVVRLVVSRGILDRAPLGVATAFSRADAERLYAFVEISNETRALSEIDVTFTSPGGESLAPIKLEVRALKRWRTWASTRKAIAPGVWSVAVSDVDGNELARTSFTRTK